MSDSPSIDLELDLRGLKCPMPMVRVSQSITSVPVGGYLRAIGDDPGCEADIPAWARLTGNEVPDIQHDGKDIILLVKRVV